MSKKNRSAWDEAMGLAGAGPIAQAKKGGKRSSGRTAVLSKAMRVVDEDTRREVRNARLEALEADNYVENVEEEPDEAYVDSEVGKTTAMPPLPIIIIITVSSTPTTPPTHTT